VPAPPPIDAIAIGASAGGLHPLRAIVAGLPTDLPATVFVVMHVAATGTSVLDQILGRSTDLEVVRARDGMALRPGLVLVAPPDRHLVLRDGRAHLTTGPRENGHRPAVDPLMRSLADERGPRAAGVILSGTRDDGALGLAALKRAGGVALVQDPEEADYSAMPTNAMASTDVDAALPVAGIAPVLTALARGEGLPGDDPPPDPTGFAPGGAPLAITCPDCGGVLTERDEAGVVHFRCHVGHAYSPWSLVALHTEGVERALWTAARSLEDRGALLQRLADRARRAGSTITADRFAASGRRSQDDARAVRDVIASLVHDPADEQEEPA
jgi:two-component system, chemotaxis family, protein-glutamate methylesterase/glutaminase